MDIWNNYISPLGYQTNGGGIDSYGVNHSGFSLRDELQYQTARQQRENQLIQNYNNQGITENYPQYSTNFWGNNADNNYGFGNSNIEANIENMQNTLNHPMQYAQNILPHTTNNENQLNYQTSQDDIFNRVFAKTLGEEGGYENKPNRIDAPTNMGIRQDTLDRFKGTHPDLANGYPENVADLTYSQVKQIARKDYFDKYRIGELQSQPLQETMFDTFFNHSPYKPALWAQQAVNQNTNMTIDEDGIFGSETIGAFNKLSPEEIIKVNNAIIDQRLADYEKERQTNPNNNYKNFSKGLPNRFNKFRIK